MTPAGRRASKAILTVDFEDWFHIADPSFSDPTIWDHLPTDVEQDTLALLDLLDEHDARATFFVVGWLVERTSDTLREIVRRNHELGVHGYYHVPPSALTENEFRRDILKCRQAIADVTGVEAKGYRAPFFGVRGCPFPYLDILGECGFRYDSSVLPGVLPGRGQPGAPAAPHEIDIHGLTMWEIPVSTVRLFGIPVAFAGGGFLRHFPSPFIDWSSARLTESGLPVVYYIHPRDLNPQGHEAPASRWRRFRYYGGRRSVRRKLRRLLESSAVTSVEGFLADGARPEPADGRRPIARPTRPLEVVGAFVTEAPEQPGEQA